MILAATSKALDNNYSVPQFFFIFLQQIQFETVFHLIPFL